MVIIMKIKRLRNFIAEKSSVIYGVAYNSTWKDSELIVFFENVQGIFKITNGEPIQK